MHVDRHWFLTWHTYGTWLPGDPRGFVSPTRDDSGRQTLHNSPGTPINTGKSKLHDWSRNQLKCSPIVFQRRHALVLAPQLLDTAARRSWQVLALSVVTNHVHVLLGVHGDPEPEILLRDLKSYGSRALNRQFGRPSSETWWTESGSKRIRKTNKSVLATIRYTLRQDGALVAWSARIPELDLEEGYKS